MIEVMNFHSTCTNETCFSGLLQWSVAIIFFVPFDNQKILALEQNKYAGHSAFQRCRDFRLQAILLEHSIGCLLCSQSL